MAMKTKTTKKTVSVITPEPKILDISAKTTIFEASREMKIEKREALKQARSTKKKEVRQTFKEAQILEDISRFLQVALKAGRDIEKIKNNLKNVIRKAKKLISKEKKIEHYAKYYVSDILPHLPYQKQFVRDEMNEKMWIGNIKELSETILSEARKILSLAEEKYPKIDEIHRLLIILSTNTQLARKRIDHLYIWEKEILRQIEDMERKFEAVLT